MSGNAIEITLALSVRKEGGQGEVTRHERDRRAYRLLLRAQVPLHSGDYRHLSMSKSICILACT